MNGAVHDAPSRDLSDWRKEQRLCPPLLPAIACFCRDSPAFDLCKRNDAPTRGADFPESRVPGIARLVSSLKQHLTGLFDYKIIPILPCPSPAESLLFFSFTTLT